MALTFTMEISLIVIAAVGVYLFINGLKNRLRYNALFSATPSQAEELSPGFRRVYGEAVPKGDYFTSPFSNQECVYYKYTVSEFRPTGGPHGGSFPASLPPSNLPLPEQLLTVETSWATIKEGDSETPFFVKDETGMVEVDPRGAEFDITEKFEITLKPDEKLPSRIQKFIEENGLVEKDTTVKGGLFDVRTKQRTRRYREYIIDERSRVFVIGTVVPKGGTQSNKNVEFVIKKDGDSPLYISDSIETFERMRKKFMWEIIGGGVIALLGIAYILINY